jgi:hypothetical protein
MAISSEDLKAISENVAALLAGNAAPNTAPTPAVAYGAPTAATEPSVSELQAIEESMSEMLKRELTKRYGDYKVKTVVPDAEDAVKAGVAKVEDELPSVHDMLAHIRNLEAQIQQLKAGPVNQVTDALASGGEPVPHDLHLQDGTVIAGHPGLATHYDDGTSVKRVVAAYPSV